jgi:hypothetical protein
MKYTHFEQHINLSIPEGILERHYCCISTEISTALEVLCPQQSFGRLQVQAPTRQIMAV